MWLCCGVLRCLFFMTELFAVAVLFAMVALGVAV